MLAGYFCICKALWVFTGVRAPEQAHGGHCASLGWKKCGDQHEHYSLAGLPDSPWSDPVSHLHDPRLVDSKQDLFLPESGLREVADIFLVHYTLRTFDTQPTAHVQATGSIYISSSLRHIKINKLNSLTPMSVKWFFPCNKCYKMACVFAQIFFVKSSSGFGQKCF